MAIIVEPLGGRNSIHGSMQESKLDQSQGTNVCIGNRKAVPATVNTIVSPVLARAVGIASDESIASHSKHYSHH